MTNLQRTRTLFLLVLGYFTILITIYFHTEYDPYWHIRVGEWIVNNLKVPDRGLFSHSKADAPWTPHEWLSEVIIYWIHKVSGWPGLVMMGVSAATISILIMLKYLLEKLPPMRALCLMLMAYGMLVTHVMPRPHMLALPIMTYWFVQLLKASELHKAPPLYLTPLLILWANIHGSFLIGIVYAMFFAFESVMTSPPAVDRNRLIKQWAIFLAVSIVCLMVTPLGIKGLLLPFQLTDQSYSLSIISEWLSPNFQEFQFLELWIVILIAFAFTQKMQLPVLRLIFLIGLIHLSLKHCRYAADLMSLQAPLLLAAPLAKHWRVARDSKENRVTIGSLVPVTAMGKALILSFFVGWGVYIVKFKDIEFLLSKKINAMLLAVHQADLPGKVFNSYDVGGYLIFQGFDTFIDSRAELYGDDFIKSFFEAATLSGGEKPLEALLNQYDISWTFLSSTSPSIAYFNMHPDWIPVYANKFAVIHARKGRWPMQAIDQLKEQLQKQSDATG